MKTLDVIVFGYKEFAKEIVSQVSEAYRSVKICTLSEELLKQATKDGYEVELFTLDDNWDEFVHCKMKETLFICALDDDAANVYLTIGLRDALAEAHIIALASTQEHASKLRLAGANKVISKLQATSDLIIEVLEKPNVTHIVHDILQEDTALKTIQITVETGSDLVGKTLSEVSRQVEHELVVMAVVDAAYHTHFVFTSKGFRHHIKEGDILVVIGYDEAIENFRRMAQ